MRKLTIALFALSLVAGCTKDKPAEVAAPKPPAPAAAPSASPLEAEEYAVAIAPKGAFAAGKEGVVGITVTAKKGFHVNPDFPVAFKPEGSEALKFAEEKVRLAAGTKTPCAEKAEDACAVEFPLSATAEAAGKAKLAGTLAFSVCAAEKCLVEKVPLTLALTVE